MIYFPCNTLQKCCGTHERVFEGALLFKMTMLAKITLYTVILVHLVLICRGGDQSDFEHVGR